MWCVPQHRQQVVDTAYLPPGSRNTAIIRDNILMRHHPASFVKLAAGGSSYPATPLVQIERAAIAAAHIHPVARIAMVRVHPVRFVLGHARVLTTALSFCLCLCLSVDAARNCPQATPSHSHAPCKKPPRFPSSCNRQSRADGGALLAKELPETLAAGPSGSWQSGGDGGEGEEYKRGFL